MTAEVELFQPRKATPAQLAAGAIAPDRADIDSWIFVASDVIRLAGYICETDFVPKSYRGNPHATAAAILAGRELDLPPMTALRHVHVVEGSASLSAEYKRARVLAAGHDFDIVELNTTRCVISARRKGSGKPAVQFTFTIEDAKRAGIFKPRGAWETRPRRMLFARAGTEACDMMFADVTNGLPTTELLEAGSTDDDALAGYNESPGQAPAKTTAEQAEPAKPRTAQRRTRQAAAEPANPTPPATGAPTQAKPGSAPATAAADDAPPFPGDEAKEIEPDHDSPGTATVGKHGQLTALWTVLRTEFGFGDEEKAQARSVCEEVIGRKLAGETTGDLSYNEAKALLDTLANWKAVAEKQGVEPREVMVAMLAKIAESRGPGEDDAAGAGEAETRNAGKRR